MGALLLRAATTAAQCTYIRCSTTLPPPIFLPKSAHSATPPSHTPSSLSFVAPLRKQITEVEHLRVLKELGWTMAQYYGRDKRPPMPEGAMERMIKEQNIYRR